MAKRARKEQPSGFGFGDGGKEPSGFGPGEMYRGIRLAEERVEGETVLTKRPMPSFVNFCRSVHKRFPSFGGKAKFNKENGAAVLFLGWDLRPEEFAAASKFILFAIILAGIAATSLVFFTPIAGPIAETVGPAMVLFYVFLPFLLAGFFVTYLFQRYPMNAAAAEKTRALTYVPELVGYMIMSMKLVPNLEKAVEFSAEHGRGKIAEDFKRLIWDVQLGVYNTLSEGLDALAYRWGRFSEEFKQALMKIRASVLENTEAKRERLLDNTMVSILESIRNKMEQYARELSQPSVLLFYLGVLLPLILIIILPVGSAFSGQAMATPLTLLLVYNIGIPIATFLFARDVIGKRPPTQEVPRIADNFPGLPKKNTAFVGKRMVNIRMLVLLIAVAGVATSFFVSVEGLPPKSLVGEDGFQILAPDKSVAGVLANEGKQPNFYDDGGPRAQQLIAMHGEEMGLKLFAVERLDFFSKSENDVTPYMLVFGLLLTAAGCFSIYTHYKFIYKRKAQLSVMQMESEFKDSLYILASRLGENKPVEEALKHTRNFLPDFKISERIFGKTVENIELLGMPLEAAVFDSNYGSMRFMPSKTIQTGMRIMVDSVKLGVNVAARTLISMSLQLSNSEKVNRTLKVLISDTTNMMRTMAVFIAPMVLGITTALQRVVMVTLSTIYSKNFTDVLETSASIETPLPFDLPQMTQGLQFSAETFNSMVTPLQFLLIVGIYVIELVVIMVYFTTRIEEDNKLLFYINLAKALPVSVAVFLVSVVASSAVVGNFFGG